MLNRLFGCISIALLVGFIAGCKQDVGEGILKNQELTVYIHQKGKPAYKKRFDNQSKEYKALLDWANNNKEGWSPTFTAHALVLPVYGKNFTLNIN